MFLLYKKTTVKTMKIIERLRLNPIPRGANYMCWKTFHMGPRYLFAHQLLYVFSGVGIGRLDAEEFLLEPGVFTIYGPGVRHEFSSTVGISFIATTMCFSWCDVTDRQLSMGNRGTETMESDYWKYADDPVQIEGCPPFPFHLKLEEPQRRILEPLFKEIGLGWRRTPQAPAVILKAKTVLLEMIGQLQKQMATDDGSAEPPALARFHRFVELNYASDIVRRDAAVAAGISESHLTALLIHHYGSNFSEYLNRIRLKAAADLLQYSTLSVKEIAATVGFRSCSYFVVRFRKQYGITPNRARHGI